MNDLERLADRFDTIVALASRGSPLYQHAIKFLRGAAALSTDALSAVETALDLFEQEFPNGVIGILLFPGFERVGPILIMGNASETETLVEFLSRRARDITRKSLTPILLDPALEKIATAAVARITETAGEA